MSFVEVESVSHAFGSQTVLRDISLGIEAGSYTVLLGPSGSGKTTLLSVLGGFLAPDAGKVLIGGRDCTALPPARRPTTTVFQDYALFPHMTVGANVGFGLRMRGMRRAPREAKAKEALALVGLSHTFARRPHQLSGGQKQRVALARALVVEPAVLLLDEPLGALDLKLRRQMQDELKAIQKRVGTAFVHVTHDQEEAMALADRLVVMNAGSVEDEGPPERVYARPATRFAAEFMGESTIFEGVASPSGEGVLSVKTALGLLPAHGQVANGTRVWLAIRPEHLLLREEPGTVFLGTARVTDVVFQGSFRRVLAVSETAPALALIARLPAGGAPPVGVGDEVPVRVRAADIVLLTR